MRVRLSDAAYVRRLRTALLAAGCLADVVEPAMLEIVHPQAVDAQEEQVELQFFVRAWQVEHPAVAAEFLS